MQIGLKIAGIQLSGDDSADEEIKWFSGIAKDLISDKYNCNLSDDEKFHFIAMHQSIVKNASAPGESKHQCTRKPKKRKKNKKTHR